MINKIIIIDIETTGFNPGNDLITEIGIVELNLETGEINPIYEELVKEEGFNESHENSWIFQNSDLKHVDVMKAEPLDKERLQIIFDRYPATAYNKKFDFDFLRSRGLEIKELPCPMLICIQICKINSSRGGFKWPNFQEAHDFFFPDAGYKETHRGSDDALNEARVVFKLYEMGEFKVE